MITVVPMEYYHRPAKNLHQSRPEIPRNPGQSPLDHRPALAICSLALIPAAAATPHCGGAATPQNRSRGLDFAVNL
jgi:hypothetical protein